MKEYINAVSVQLPGRASKGTLVCSHRCREDACPCAQLAAGVGLITTADAPVEKRIGICDSTLNESPAVILRYT